MARDYPLLFVALTLGACSANPIAETDGKTTTSQGATSSSTTGESEDTSAESGDTLGEGPWTGGSGPLDLPNDEPVACDVWLQDCPLNEKCVPYASSGGTWDAHRCVPILGGGQLDETCISGGKFEATDDCGAGLTCWGVSEVEGQLVGQCAGLCGGSFNEPQCGVGTGCMAGPWSDAPAVCALACDPLLQDCPQDLACTYVAEQFFCTASKGSALGQPCESFEDCEVGTMCVPSELLPSCAGSSCCAAYCDLTDPVCAAPGTGCAPIICVEAGPPIDPPIDIPGVCIDPEQAC